MKVLDPVFLTLNTGARSVDQNSVLVNDINNSGDLSGLGAIVENGNASNLDEALERLETIKQENKSVP